MFMEGQENQEEKLVKGDRIVDFPSFMLWKTICFLDGSRVPRKGRPKAASESDIKEFSERCVRLGVDIFKAFGKTCAAFQEKPNDWRCGFIIDLLVNSSELVSVTTGSRTEFAVLTLRCWLRYYGIRLKNESDSLHRKVCDLLSPILDSALTPQQKKLALRNSEIAGKRFSEFFGTGDDGESEQREVGVVARYFASNYGKKKELIKKVIEMG